MMIDIFRNWLKRYWWAWLSAVVLALLMVVCWKWLSNHSDTLRNLALVIFAPLGLALATWRSIIADKNTQIADRNSLIAEDNSITDAFTRAIEQLGSGLDDKPNIEVRLGAIYALERLSQKNDAYYQAIIDILASYVRNNAPIPPESERFEDDMTRIDVQTAMTVIGRRKSRTEEPILNLAKTYLPRVDLTNAELRYAIMHGSYLREARIEGANFRGASLENAYIPDVSRLDHIDFLYPKAVAELDSRSMEVRLGAISTLEKISKTDYQYYQRVIDTLTGYVRKNAPIPSKHKMNSVKIDDTRKDVQKVLSVLASRTPRPKEPVLNLVKVYLPGVNLAGGCFSGANFRGSCLHHAVMDHINLFQADLSYTNLDDADVKEGDLRGAIGLTCNQLTSAYNWDTTYRDDDLACDAEIPEPPPT